MNVCCTLQLWFIMLRTSNLCCFNLSLSPTASKELIAHQNIKAYTCPGSCNFDNTGQWLSYRMVKLNNLWHGRFIRRPKEIIALFIAINVWDRARFRWNRPIGQSFVPCIKHFSWSWRYSPYRLAVCSLVNIRLLLLPTVEIFGLVPSSDFREILILLLVEPSAWTWM